MAPLVVQLASWLVLRALGWAGVAALDSWAGALRFALAAMFVFTGLAHFLPRMRADILRMVPPQLPWREGLVTLSGLLEFAGAAVLTIPALARWAACGLIALLVAMFPANIHAARERLMIVRRRAEPLWIRLPMQLFWIGCLAVVAYYGPR
jgi:uncharacterized membrane protein